MNRKRFLMPVMVALFAALFATSCGPDAIIEGSQTRVMQATVYRNQWKDSGVGYLWCSFEWDALTPNALKYGNIAAYIYEDERQCPLPHVIPVTYNVNGDDVVVPENFRYDVETGVITFIMQDLDGAMPEDINEDFIFRAVVTVPQQYLID